MISKRLNEILKLCGRKKRIADVGCDHGKVLGELFKKGAKFLVASDISEPSVKKAEKLLNELNCNNFSIRVGNGFETLSDEDNLDLIIVSGIGGLEIIEILKNSKIKLSNLVLQPQNNVVKLRQYLSDNNFYIITDKVVEDKNKFYNLLKVRKVENKIMLTTRELNYGKTNIKGYNPEFVRMLEYENEKLADRIQNIKNEKLKTEILTEMLENNKEMERAKNRR